MKTEEIALSRITENEENPRTITTEKFQKLVKSILVFPRMLTLRPIVVDETFKVLGGNMRLKALRHITTMQEDGILAKLEEDTRLTEAERNLDIAYWRLWQKKPTATIVKADDLTEAQKREFIIKDNVGFGDWDTNMLANQWNTDLLKDWGLQDWQLQGFGGNSSDNTELSDDEDDEGEDTATEIDVVNLAEKIKVELHFTIAENIFINDKLSQVGGTKEEALLKLLGYEG